MSAKQRGRPTLAVVAARQAANAHVGAQLTDFEAVAFWRRYEPQSVQEARAVREGVALGTAWRTWQRTVGQVLLERRAGWAEEEAA